MKFSHIFFVLGILLCLSSCSKDNFEPYIPTEWQYDKYSDSSILPGDDFYRFVCGKGIATEGSDSWAPLSCWLKQQEDYTNLIYSESDDNPVPVLKRLNELKKAAVSEEQKYAAFASMRERLNGIEERTRGKEFPEKAAEYFRNGYLLFYVYPKDLDGHKFGFLLNVHFDNVLRDWNQQQLEFAGIKDKYNKLLPKARIFEKYLWDNIKGNGESIQNLNAGIFEECRQLKEYVESFTRTKAGSNAFERFASAIGNRNPDFVPSDDMTSQFFELIDKMDAEMKEAADAFLWCASASLDIKLILTLDTGGYFFVTAQYPSLLINMSHTFCDNDMYVKPECGTKNRGIFEALRRTMTERIEQSDWLSPYTKAGARKKIDAMECHTGILDWAKYEADMPVADDFCSALHEIGCSYVSKMMAISGENSNLDHIIAAIYMTPIEGGQAYSANSFYIPNANAMLLLPSTSLLHDMDQEFPFMMYITAHELCHGFDATGANYDASGQFVDWWSIDDRLVFKKKQEQLISIFNQYYVGETTFCNGTQTITEDMADLGGMEIAYCTVVKELEEKFGGEELLEMKRRFFKSYAVCWAKYSSLGYKLEQIEIDTHSINEYRVNGIVNNIDDWYQLFDVTPERKFYLAPERRVYLW